MRLSRHAHLRSRRCVVCVRLIDSDLNIIMVGEVVGAALLLNHILFISEVGLIGLRAKHVRLGVFERIWFLDSKGTS